MNKRFFGGDSLFNFPVIALFFTMLLPGIGLGSGVDSLKSAGADPVKKRLRFRCELKREATDRGTPDETTNSSVKADVFFYGVVSLLRLEIPFPDEKTDFEGNFFDPRLGDIKTRVGFRAIRLPGMKVSSFVELTWPTASPSSLGNGKYQASIGIEAAMRLSKPDSIVQTHKFTFDLLIQQVASYAGDPERKGINYTKFEFNLTDTWKKLIWFKLSGKPVIDWEKKANTGSVAEIEIGWIISHHFRLWLLGGKKLWGEGIPGTYDKRLSLAVAYQF
jgi:hypothetical protein